MKKAYAGSFRCSPAGLRVGAIAVVALAGLAAPSPAQVGRPGLAALVIPAQAQVSNAEAVRLLVGLASIRADLQLAMLAGSDASAAAHYGHARAEVWPGLKDAILAAGAPDLEPILQKLEAGGEDAGRKALVEAEGALLKARSLLHPADADAVQAVLALAKAAAGQINTSGPTEARDYQTAWAFLMVARGELDLLSRSGDPAIAKLAVSEGMAIDEIFISMPDPGQMTPVSFDAAPILELIGRLENTDEAA